MEFLSTIFLMLRDFALSPAGLLIAFLLTLAAGIAAGAMAVLAKCEAERFEGDEAGDTQAGMSTLPPPAPERRRIRALHAPLPYSFDARGPAAPAAAP